MTPFQYSIHFGLSWISWDANTYIWKIRLIFSASSFSTPGKIPCFELSKHLFPHCYPPSLKELCDLCSESCSLLCKTSALVITCSRTKPHLCILNAVGMNSCACLPLMVISWCCEQMSVLILPQNIDYRSHSRLFSNSFILCNFLWC